ncbi:hypothetical protein KI688_005901 [Linnemannia hyalina]|uniref:Uncharacterized protein n=1 Tax=Linnemannia hyalina TaxID=64524 RepID=A0A9P7Y3P3_9FUNG|nr:hypothetical protein KI688_005901 [Linnemannia hyalina]
MENGQDEGVASVSMSSRAKALITESIFPAKDFLKYGFSETISYLLAIAGSCVGVPPSILDYLQAMSADLYKERREFILQNANKNIKQIAQEFFEVFDLSNKQTALDALHTSLYSTDYTELTKLLKENDFKEWATHYFSQAKKRKKMSVQNIVDKERNKLQIAGVVQGSRFIESGMGLLAPEEDRIAASTLANRPPSTLTSSSSTSLPPSTYTAPQQDEEHMFSVAEGVPLCVTGEHDKRATPLLTRLSSDTRPSRSFTFPSSSSSVETKNPSTEHSPTEPETDADASEVQIVCSRAKSTPFYDLIAYVFQKVKKKPAVLPSFIPGGLSSNHKELYKAALDELRKPGPVQAKKDVLVMLSGIINTVVPSGRCFSLSKTIVTSSQLTPVDPNSDTHKAVKEVLERLLNALYPSLEKDRYADPQFVQLQKTIWQGLCHAVDLKQTVSGMATGELISKSSTDARQLAEAEFGSTTSSVSGRKVDMSLRIQVDNQWRSEIAVFEFKTASASQHICDIQQKKSVRLNAAILMDLEERGLDLTRHYPIIAEGKGLSMDFYALRRHGDVLGAGRATEHLRRFSIDVTDTLAQSNATPFNDDDYDYYEQEETPMSSPLSNTRPRPSTPPPRKRSNPFILFSPANKNKRNHGRRRSQAEKKDELDYEDEDDDEYDGHD